jgi:hypothetical protein
LSYESPVDPFRFSARGSSSDCDGWAELPRMSMAIGRRSSGGRGGRPAFPRRRRLVLSVKPFLNRTKTVRREQAHRAARLISVNNRLTLPSHSAPSVHLAMLPISEKPAASAKSWYLLSSLWFAPAPGEPRPEGRRGLAPQMRYARRPHGHKLEGADPR